MLKPLSDNEFAILVTRRKNDKNNTNFLNLTLEKDVYYNIPKEYRSFNLSVYKPIIESSLHSAFLKYINDKLKDGSDRSWSRHYRFKIKEKDGKLSEEAKIFMNDKLIPIIGGTLMIKEKEDNENIDNANEDNLNLSIEQLSKVFGKFKYINMIIIIMN